MRSKPILTLVPVLKVFTALTELVIRRLNCSALGGYVLDDVALRFIRVRKKDRFVELKLYIRAY